MGYALHAADNSDASGHRRSGARSGQTKLQKIASLGIRFVSSGITGKGIVEVTRSVLPYLLLIYGVLFLITYVPWISLILPRLIQ